ncbi:MAG: RNA-binding transcriptional accessory protein [Synergistaceae bacterium]|jgi:uncharacterized protein|nr:RNA-binding transcriptional accessory protein [Synergistaceae bacterium]
MAESGFIPGVGIAEAVAAETGINLSGVRAVLALLENGGTVPFIARYRKEATGSLDEVAIMNIRDRSVKLMEMEKRRAAIIASCEEQGALSEALKKSLESARSMAELEDLYLPYRPKRRTRAMIAKERGLDGLAIYIMKQKNSGLPLADAAAKYVSPDKGVESVGDALAGARDIIAESVSEHAGARGRVRSLYARRAVIYSSAPKKMPEGDSGKYRDYYDAETAVYGAPSHRILALFRGEREGFLKLGIEPEEGAALGILRAAFIRGDGEESEQVDEALRDSYKRLLGPSMETELRAVLRESADDDAIMVFAKNLHSLLMASPYGGRRILAVDPGFKSGCKLVALNEHGGLMHYETVYPHLSQNRTEEAGTVVAKLVREYGLCAAAVGNGTAGRETDSWLRGLGLPINVVMVSESGASIYSASEVARDEFPDLDLTVRGAVSIGRRLQDPLAELVKIDPKSIGVGQYQHDVDQKKLRGALDDVVINCVNQVGVDVNSASRELLKYVSGLGATLAANVVKFRDGNGGFSSREDFRKVPRMGPKAFEQSAGFMRITGGGNPLDASAVHPENYGLVARLARDIGCTVAELMSDEKLRARIEPGNYSDVGEATMRDILSELAKPGRDTRGEFEFFSFDENVHELSDLKPGMTLPGIVSNVTDFGMFVDVGVHQDGLLHRSRVKPGDAKRFAPGSRLSVEVLEVDEARGRIALGLAKESNERNASK